MFFIFEEPAKYFSHFYQLANIKDWKPGLPIKKILIVETEEWDLHRSLLKSSGIIFGTWDNQGYVLHAQERKKKSSGLCHLLLVRYYTLSHLFHFSGRLSDWF